MGFKFQLNGKDMFPHSLAHIIERIENRQWQGSIRQTSNDKAYDAECLHELMAQWQNRIGTLSAGDTVLVLADHSVETIAVMCVLWERGITVVPLDPEMPNHSWRKIGEHANASALVDSKIGTVELLAPDPTKSVNYRVAPKVTGVDTALIIYTSGSTGDPKGIALTHQNVISALYAISDYLAIDALERILCISPLCFDYGLYQVLFTLLNDTQLVLFDQKFTPISAIKAINNHQITLLPAVPSMANSILKGLQVYKKTVPTLCKLTNTGGHLPQETINGFLDLMPSLDVYPMYGLTESKRALYLAPEDVRLKPGSVGKAMPGLVAKVLVWNDSTLQWREAEVDEVGELCVRGGSVMQGYLGMENDEQVFIQGSHPADRWLRTGDLFRVDCEGYFYFVERAKALIKQGGYCLYPQNIVADLVKCPLVDDAAVVGSEENGQEIAIAFIVLAHPSNEETQLMVKDWIHQNIDRGYVPARIEYLEKLPLNVNGKVDKKQLLVEVMQDA
jgi:acyl-CoA synthetase (AMP-forming)/AMP-acid ligase II